MTSVVLAVPLFLVALALVVIVIPVVYCASGKFPPAWRWLIAYVGLMGFAAFVLRLS